MKAAVGKNVKINLSEAFQTSKEQTESLAVKGVPTVISENELKEFLGLNKIFYVKAERLEINDPTEAEALISQNLVCHCIRSGRISVSSFGHAVLQLPKFQSFG